MILVMFDIDDTVADFSTTASQLLKYHFGNPLEFNDTPLRQQFKVNGCWQWGLSHEEFQDFIIETQMLEQLQPFPDASHVVNKLYDVANEIIFCTARNFHPKANKITMDWLEQHGFAYDKLWIVDKAVDKKDPAKDCYMIVDDNPKALPDHMNRKTAKRFLIDDFYNKRYIVSESHSLSDVCDFIIPNISQVFYYEEAT